MSGATLDGTMPAALIRDLRALEARCAGETLDDAEGAESHWRIIARRWDADLYVLEGVNTGDIAVWERPGGTRLGLRTLELWVEGVKPVLRWVFTDHPGANIELVPHDTLRVS